MNGFIEQICSSSSIYLFILNELSIVCLIYMVLNFLIFNFFSFVCWNGVCLDGKERNKRWKVIMITS
ncbi:hypothetical protein WN943_029026 [Citrus x changshan-huyou]